LVSEALVLLGSKDKCKDLSHNASKMAFANASSHIAQEVLNLLPKS